MQDTLLKIRSAILKDIPENRASFLKGFIRPILAFFYQSNLVKLAILFCTDKYGSHWYIPHYEKHLRHLRRKKINLLEIGVGGEDNPKAGGHSLRMWKNYFRNGNIYSIDIVDKTNLQEDRVTIFQGDQSDEGFLSEVCNNVDQPFDVIIDDGSHINEHIIKSFEFLFPYLKSGGIYVIEDLQTSYWPSYGGNHLDLDDQKTAMGYLKALADGLNYKEFKRQNVKSKYFDENIVSIHFYHNLVFIYKGSNDEASNVKPADLENLLKD